MLCLLRLLGLLLRGRSGKAIVSGLTLAVSSLALAATGCVYQYKTGNYPTAIGACNAYIADVQPSNPGVSMSVSSVQEFGDTAICMIASSSKDGQWTDRFTVGKVCRCP